MNRQEGCGFDERIQDSIFTMFLAWWRIKATA